MTIACGQQQPGARTAAETRLPLYLKGRERTSVDAEGPALVVRKVGRAAVRYPLARLARIIAGAKIQWSGRALRLCMDAEIPIVLVGDGDTPVGYVQPAVLHRSRLDGLLLQWVDCPQWPDRLQNWQRAQRMFLVKAWHSAHEQIDAGAADGDFKELVRRYVQETDPARADSGKIYRAALAAFATQKIQEAGLAARYWGHGGEALDLRLVLTQLMELALTLEFSALGRAGDVDPAARMRILHAFGQTLAHHARRLLGSLHQMVRSDLEEWR